MNRVAEAPALGHGPLCTLKGQILYFPPLLDKTHAITTHRVVRTGEKTMSGKKYPRDLIRDMFIGMHGWECPKTGDVYGYHVPVMFDRDYCYGDEYNPAFAAADASLLLRGDDVLAQVMLLDTPAGHQLHYLLATDQCEMFARGPGRESHGGTVQEYTLVYLMGRLDKQVAMSRHSPRPGQKGAGRGNYAVKPVVRRPMQTAA